ncbi:MAG: cupin domain-containing protein [Gammaproteobacteria bacterium]
MPKAANKTRVSSPQAVALDPSFHKGKFNLNRAKDSQFQGGLRKYFEYRDLGMAAATQGKVMAQVIRAKGPCLESGDRHYHVLDFQMVYVLKGWSRTYFEGIGELRMEAGDCMYQQPGIRHQVLEYSDDYEVIEITVPADFETHTVEPN